MLAYELRIKSESTSKQAPILTSDLSATRYSKVTNLRVVLYKANIRGSIAVRSIVAT
jgi:hypothetical protein